jgi:hypothetical protein
MENELSTNAIFNRIRRREWRTRRDLEELIFRTFRSSWDKRRVPEAAVEEILQVRKEILADPSLVHSHPLNDPSKHPLWLKIYILIEERTSLSSRIYAIGYFSIMLVGLIPIIWQSIPHLNEGGQVMQVLEIFFVVLAAFEAILRMIVYPVFLDYLEDIGNWLDFALIVSLLIDLGGIGITSSGDFGQLLYLLRPVFRLLVGFRRLPLPRLFQRSIYLARESLALALYVLVLLIYTFGALLFFSTTVNSKGKIPDILDGAYITLYTIPGVGFTFPKPVWAVTKVVILAAIAIGTTYMPIPLRSIGSFLERVWKHRYTLLVIKLSEQRFRDFGFGKDPLCLIHRSMDIDKDGKVSLSDFKSFCRLVYPEISENIAIEVFKDLDPGGQGHITQTSFIMCLIRYGFDTKSGILQCAKRDELLNSI